MICETSTGAELPVAKHASDERRSSRWSTRRRCIAHQWGAPLDTFRVPGSCFRRSAQNRGLLFLREATKYGLTQVFTVIEVFILGAVLDHGFSDGKYSQSFAHHRISVPDARPAPATRSLLGRSRHARAARQVARNRGKETPCPSPRYTGRAEPQSIPQLSLACRPKKFWGFRPDQPASRSEVPDQRFSLCNRLVWECIADLVWT
jgi:hypothetical protein